MSRNSNTGICHLFNQNLFLIQLSAQGFVISDASGTTLTLSSNKKQTRSVF